MAIVSIKPFQVLEIHNAYQMIADGKPILHRPSDLAIYLEDTPPFDATISIRPGLGRRLTSINQLQRGRKFYTVTAI